MPQMNAGLNHWTVDEVAECLDISSDLGSKLWGFLNDAEERTPLGGDGSLDSRGNPTVETPDGRQGDQDDKIKQCWSKLTREEQHEINQAYRKEYDEV